MRVTVRNMILSEEIEGKAFRWPDSICVKCSEKAHGTREISVVTWGAAGVRDRPQWAGGTLGSG